MDHEDIAIRRANTFLTTASIASRRVSCRHTVWTIHGPGGKPPASVGFAMLAGVTLDGVPENVAMGVG